MKDYTGKFCDLNPLSNEWPMYSFDRAAYSFWNGFANGLKDKGFRDDQIKDWLQSKLARWLLDADSEKIENLGYEMAKDAELMPDSWK